MSLKVLELDCLQLTISEDHLKLSVISAADIRIPTSLSTLDNATMVKALTAGEIWVSRGISCRLDIEVFFNGEPLDQNSLQLLESVGYRIRDATLWPQLSLSTLLDIPGIKMTNCQPDISIAIKRGTEPQMLQIGPRALLVENVDIRPPESVLCAEFERLQIQFNFLSTQDKQPSTAKRIKSGSAGSEEVDKMLFDLSSDARRSHLEELENVVGGLKSLSDTIKSSFAPPGPVHEMLFSQCQQHGSATYEQLGKSNMPLPEIEQDRPTCGQEDSEEDEMLFSQRTASTTSIVSSIFSTVMPSTSALKRSTPGNDTTPEAFLIDSAAACKLADVTLEILIGGFKPGRGQRGYHAVQVEKPPPELSLSDMVPVMFSPRFKESIANNARFLPTISHAVSISWPRNVQSPSLRRKLTQLASVNTSSLTDDNPDGAGEVGSSGRLAAVVQARLWVMMQRKLYDPTAARKMLQKSSEQHVAKVDEVWDDECPNLLRTLKHDEESQFVDLSGNAVGDDFERMLMGDEEDEEGLLDYLEDSERERLAIEQVTEEMLFGNGWDENDEDDLLFRNENDNRNTGEEELSLDGGSDNDSMLV